MDIYEALYTTRAMRRVRPDPIPLEVQARMLDAAIRAPSGGNSQNWRFLLADDTDVIGRIGPLYATRSINCGKPSMRKDWPPPRRTPRRTRASRC